MRTLIAALVTTLALATLVGTVAAQTEVIPEELGHHHHHGDEHVTPVPLNFRAQLAPVKRAAISLPIAGLLAAVLAFRPRRPGTPRRTPAVIQTQIILALVGAVVMLIVGQSLARAFGIVGAAGLVRYRAKIEDPKDAGVMLSTLAIGLASGVGHFMLAGFATALLLAFLWGVESLEPEGKTVFALKVKCKDCVALRPHLETVLQNFGLRYELRASSAEELEYEVKVPWGTRTDRVSNAILRLDKDNAVEWDEKKEKKNK